MYHRGIKVKPRGPMLDNSRNISVRMTEEQYQRLERYRKLTRLTRTNYFRKLIEGRDFKGRVPELYHAIHTSVNMICSNVRQITRCQRSIQLDADTVEKIEFLMDKVCEEAYLLANQR